MLVLGLILILLSAGTLVAVLSSGTDDHARLFGGAIDVSTLVVFLAGAAALLVFIIGTRAGPLRRAPGEREPQDQEEAPHAGEARGAAHRRPGRHDHRHDDHRHDRHDRHDRHGHDEHRQDRHGHGSDRHLHDRAGRPHRDAAPDEPLTRRLTRRSARSRPRPR